MPGAVGTAAGLCLALHLNVVGNHRFLEGAAIFPTAIAVGIKRRDGAAEAGFGIVPAHLDPRWGDRQRRGRRLFLEHAVTGGKGFIGQGDELAEDRRRLDHAVPLLGAIIIFAKYQRPVGLRWPHGAASKQRGAEAGGQSL